MPGPRSSGWRCNWAARSVPARRTGDRADEVAAALAAGLELADPGRPWHTDRSPIGALAAAIALAAAALATVARNVVLLSATDIGELHEASPGGSSSMPHKRNPARATLVLAATNQIPGLVAGVLAGLPVEEQRPAGSWQAEMPAVRQLLLLLGGAARTAGQMLGGLAVDAARMERNRTAAGDRCRRDGQ